MHLFSVLFYPSSILLGNDEQVILHDVERWVIFVLSDMICPKYKLAELKDYTERLLWSLLKGQIDSVVVYVSTVLFPSFCIRGETLNVFLHDDAVYGLSVSPVNDNVFASSADDGRVLIWDTREPPHGGTHTISSFTVSRFAGNLSGCILGFHYDFYHDTIVSPFMYCIFNC